MGFIGDFFHNHRMTDPVRGRALVVDVNDWLLETSKPYTLRTTLVVEADGVPKTTVEHSELVNASSGTHLDRWPAQGDTIPVTIDRADPTRVLIEWDAMRGKSDKLRDAERERAEARKQQLLAHAYGTNAPPPAASPSMSSSSAPGCPRCQSDNPKGSAFCRNCGGRLPP